MWCTHLFVYVCVYVVIDLFIWLSDLLSDPIAPLM